MPTLIVNLDLDDKIIEVLTGAGFDTVESLPDDLTAIDGIGEGRARQIRAAIGSGEEAAEEAAEEAVEDAAENDADAPDDSGQAPAEPAVAAPSGLDDWEGTLTDGRGILRRESEGVHLKLLCEQSADGVASVTAIARDHHGRAQEIFGGDGAIREAAAWALEAAAHIAARRPEEAEMLVPLRDIKGASTDALRARLDRLGDVDAMIAEGKQRVRASQAQLREAITRLEGELQGVTQQWRERARALQDCAQERSAITHELAERDRRAAKEAEARRRVAAERAEKHKQPAGA